MDRLDKEAIWHDAWEVQRLSENIGRGVKTEPNLKMLETMKKHADDIAFLLKENIKRIKVKNRKQKKEIEKETLTPTVSGVSGQGEK